MSYTVTVLPVYQNVQQSGTESYTAATFPEWIAAIAGDATNAVITIDHGKWLGNSYPNGESHTYLYSLSRRMNSNTDMPNLAPNSSIDYFYTPTEVNVNKTLLSVLQYGIYGNVSRHPTGGELGSECMVFRFASLTVTFDDSLYSYLQPTIVAPTGAVAKGGTYRLTWTIKESLPIATQILQYAPINDAATVYSVTVDNNKRYLDFDTADVDMAGISWRVGIQVDGVIDFDGVPAMVQWTDWNANNFTQPTVTVTQTNPPSGGNAYHGVSVPFRWSIDAVKPDDAVSVNIYQTAAQIRYRSVGTTEYTTVQVAGSTPAYTMAGNVLPLGNLEWQAVVVTNTGYAFFSAWTTLKNTELAPVIVEPTSSLVRGGIYRMRWTQPTADGAVFVTRYVQYRVADTEDAATITLTPDTAYYDFDTTKVASTVGMEWRVGVVVNQLVISWSGWQRNTFTQPSVTISDLYPTGTVYKGFATVFRWTLAYSAPSSAIGTNIYQTSAELRYRVAGATSYTAISIPGQASSYTVAGSIFPVGAVEWQLAATINCGYTYTSGWQAITNTEIAIAIDGMYPSEDGHAVKSVANRFGWTFAAEDDEAPGAVTQASAKLYWRNGSTGAYTLIEISGAQQFYDVPAGTFTASTIEWYVVVTASTGTQTTSGIVQVSTLDTLSTPATVSPSGVYMDDTNGCTFCWQHINATGTAQSGWELGVSTDQGASYTVLTSGQGAAQSYTSAAKALSIGMIYWRVRTKNADGLYGSYSTAAIFMVKRAPDAPVITYSSADKPLPVISWQASGQTGYEVEVDGTSATDGLTYGTVKTWRGSMLLADGKHAVRVRICNEFGDISDWTAITMLVANVPSGSIAITIREMWAQVSVCPALVGAFTRLYLLRDDEVIQSAEPDAPELIDRTSVGAHRYTVRAFTASGYYTDSPEMQAAARVPYGAIGLRDGDSWSLLKWTTDKNWLQVNTSTASGSLLRYYGRTYPVWDADHDSRNETVTVTYLMRDVSMRELSALLGKEIVYKDFKGNCVTGVFASVPITKSGKYATVSLSITRTEQTEVRYDPV